MCSPFTRVASELIVAFLRRLMNSQPFADEDQAQIVRLFKVLLIALIPINIIHALFNIGSLSVFIVSCILIIIEIFLLVVIQRGYMRLSAWFFCMLLWIAVTIIVSRSGGLNSPGQIVFVIILVLATTLLGLQAAMIFGGLFLLTTAALYIAEVTGLTPEQLIVSREEVALNTVLFVIGLTASLIVLAYQTRRSLERARQREQELAQRNQQLQLEILQREQAQRTSQRMVAILEATTDFVGIIDVWGHQDYLNHAIRERIKPRTDQSFMFDIYPDWVMNILLNKAIPVAIAEGVWTGETAFLDRDDTEVPVSQVVIAHKNEQGNLEYISTIMRDLTETRRTEKERLELALQKERVDVLQQLIGDMSHDLKTPLTAINSSLYLLERQPDPEKRREKITNIREHVQRLDNIIQDLLTLSRLDQGARTTFMPVDLAELLTEAETKMRPLADRKKIQFTIDSQSDLTAIFGSANDLLRIMLNLIENALHYTPEEGRVSVRLYENLASLIFEVSDTGVGIAAEDIPFIFDRFFRAANAQALLLGGSGLGLAIVKKIVQLHSGTIEVESTPHKGSLFRVSLPLRPPIVTPS